MSLVLLKFNSKNFFVRMIINFHQLLKIPNPLNLDVISMFLTTFLRHSLKLQSNSLETNWFLVTKFSHFFDRFFQLKHAFSVFYWGFDLFDTFCMFKVSARLINGNDITNNVYSGTYSTSNCIVLFSSTHVIHSNVTSQHIILPITLTVAKKSS